MANVSCSSCEDLRQNAPNLIVNGLGSAECTHLKNNTGVGGNSTDCADLNDMNDCFIGNMEPEIDTYDVCDWKEYMKKFVPNVWTVLKGIICAICGLWDNFDDLAETIRNICQLQEATLQHPVIAYGTRPQGTSAVQGGTLGKKGGNDILIPLTQQEMSPGAWPNQNAGIRYGKLEVISCTTGACRRHEWIAPDFLGYKFNSSVTLAYGDVLWSCSKSVAQNTFGITDEQWTGREQNPISWVTDFAVLGTGLVAIRVAVNNNMLEVQYAGCIGCDASDLQGKTLQPPADQAERMYRYSC